jgi:hypothetical protein
MNYLCGVFCDAYKNKAKQKHKQTAKILKSFLRDKKRKLN